MVEKRIAGESFQPQNVKRGIDFHEITKRGLVDGWADAGRQMSRLIGVE